MSGTIPPSLRTVVNACRGVLEGSPKQGKLSPSDVQRIQLALEAGVVASRTFADGTILLVVEPPRSPVERLKERLDGLTPGQHRIALKRIADVLSKVEAATGDVAQAKLWLVEGFTVRHTAWSDREWIRLDGSGCLMDENGHTLDAEGFFPEQESARGLWEIVP